MKGASSWGRGFLGNRRDLLMPHRRFPPRTRRPRRSVGKLDLRGAGPEPDRRGPPLPGRYLGGNVVCPRARLSRRARPTSPRTRSSGTFEPMHFRWGDARRRHRSRGSIPIRWAAAGALAALVAAAVAILFGIGMRRSFPRFPKANLILVSIDTLRRDALGIHGAGPNATPTSIGSPTNPSSSTTRSRPPTIRGRPTRRCSRGSPPRCTAS